MCTHTDDLLIMLAKPYINTKIWCIYGAFSREITLVLWPVMVI